MDNHPIPQDVTNFQFRLIGDMTLKQFGYIVAGVVFAWVMLASPVFFLLRLVLAGGCVLASVILAFVPIEGRPSDIMLVHFLRALFSPTQFTYQKSSFQQTTMPIPTQATTMTATPVSPREVQEKKEEKKEKVQVESFAPIATAAVTKRIEDAKALQPQEVQQAASSTILPAEGAKQDEKLQHEVDDLSRALAQAKAQEAREANTATATMAHEKVSSLETELQDIMKQKDQLEKQLITLQKSLAEKKQQVFTPTTAVAPIEETQHVKKLPKQMSVGAGAPLIPDFPNLISGIIKDPRGNVLSNILIEIKDKDGNPVRAFKTNQLGQFAAATPLVNGTYSISFEDPAGKQSFDSVEIIAEGGILSPLEIISVDAREKLRQELFGAQNTPA